MRQSPSLQSGCPVSQMVLSISISGVDPALEKPKNKQAGSMVQCNGEWGFQSLPQSLPQSPCPRPIAPFRNETRDLQPVHCRRGGLGTVPPGVLGRWL